MALGALMLAAGVPYLDRALPDDWLRNIPLVYSGRPAGARAVLSTIATSMITVAGVVFSMTIVSLQLASSQFGPRLLRTFMRDRGNQIVLGAFLGTFLYCVLVLPTVDAATDAAFVPHIAISLAVLQAIVCLGMLVYYIDHIAQSIHADAVMSAVATELQSSIDSIYPEHLGENATQSETKTADAALRDGEPAIIRATTNGYLRFVNGDAILNVAREHNLFVSLTAQPGAFVKRDDDLASIWPAERLSDEAGDSIRSAVVLGAHRTTLQDAAFAFEQLTEMALRALSPGINDPTTAAHCIDRIAAGLCRLVTREFPPPLRLDEDDVPRLETSPVPIEHILDVSIAPIARNAGPHLSVWLRLLDALDAAHTRATRETDRRALRDLAARLASRAAARFEDEHDRERLAETAGWASTPS